MSKIQIIPRKYNAYYEQLEGDTPFVIAVNKKIADFWVATGNELGLLDASLEVLSDLYDEIKKVN